MALRAFQGCVDVYCCNFKRVLLGAFTAEPNTEYIGRVACAAWAVAARRRGASGRRSILIDPILDGIHSTFASATFHPAPGSGKAPEKRMPTMDAHTVTNLAEQNIQARRAGALVLEILDVLE